MTAKDAAAKAIIALGVALAGVITALAPAIAPHIGVIGTALIGALVGMTPALGGLIHRDVTAPPTLPAPKAKTDGQ